MSILSHLCAKSAESHLWPDDGTRSMDEYDYGIIGEGGDGEKKARDWGLHDNQWEFRESGDGPQVFLRNGNIGDLDWFVSKHKSELFRRPRTDISKHAGLPLGVGNVLSNIGSSVTRGATRAVSSLATAAPQTATRFAPQISRGIGLMAKNPKAVGGAALGAGALTIGGALSQRQ